MPRGGDRGRLLHGWCYYGGGFDGFRCLGLLGAGGFGTTWKVAVQFDDPEASGSSDALKTLLENEDWIAREVRDGDGDGRRATVAAKVSNHDTTPKGLEFALKEATAWARLPPHPDVVNLLNVDFQDGRYFAIRRGKCSPKGPESYRHR